MDCYLCVTFCIAKEKGVWMNADFLGGDYNGRDD